MIELRARLASNVRRLREVRGWTQEQAAEACGLDRTLWQGLEAGRGNTTLVTLGRLCGGLQVDVVALLAPAPAIQRKPGRPRKRPLVDPG